MQVVPGITAPSFEDAGLNSCHLTQDTQHYKQRAIVQYEGKFACVLAAVLVLCWSFNALFGSVQKESSEITCITSVAATLHVGNSDGGTCNAHTSIHDQYYCSTSWRMFAITC